MILNPIKVEDVGQFRAIVAVDGRGGRLVRADLALHDGRGPRHRHGRGRRGRRGRPGASSAAATAPCARSAPSSPAPASRSGSCPAGTGNLLARNLGIPLYLRAAIDVALNGQDRAIDMVEVAGDGIEDTHFMVMAGHGLRRRDHGGRQRGHQEAGRLGRLRALRA